MSPVALDPPSDRPMAAVRQPRRIRPIGKRDWAEGINGRWYDGLRCRGRQRQAVSREVRGAGRRSGAHAARDRDPARPDRV